MTDRPSPFHPGERAVQERLGVADQIGPFAARVVRDHMPDQHRDFYHALPMIFIGAVDASGQPWASLRLGPPGFITSPSPYQLDIAATGLAGDPLASSLGPEAEIGLLGLQFETRRRNRMNGQVTAADANTLSIKVSQAFGNCPQYIHRRKVDYRLADTPARPAPIIADQLDDRAREIVAHADTFFIASASLDGPHGWSRGADVSHRGGPPGFVECLTAKRLLFPDYSGNNHFNTLGNLVGDPRAGLLFIDFARGDCLFLAVRADIIWDGPDVAARAGAQRLVSCTVTQMVRLERAIDTLFAFIDHSPSLSHL